jgi:hypothetical protein
VSRERGGNLVSIEGAPDIIVLIDEMVHSIVNDPQNRSKLLKLFCQTCSAIREKGLMCQKCQSEMPEEWAEKCFFCRE